MKVLRPMIFLVGLLGVAGVLGLSSCSLIGEYTDVMVDKSKIKGSTGMHDLYPSSAVVPVVNADKVNADKVNELFRYGLERVNKSLRGGTK